MRPVRTAGIPRAAGDERCPVPESGDGNEKALMRRIRHRNIDAILRRRERAVGFHAFGRLRHRETMRKFVGRVRARHPEHDDSARLFRGRRRSR